MTSHFVLRSTTLAAAFLVFATSAANAACSIDEASASPTTDEVLPTRARGQLFSFVATGACRNLVFSVDGSTLTKTPTTDGTCSTADREYKVFLTESELSSVVDESPTTLTWSITAYGTRGRAIAHVTTTNEFDVDADVDADGWTRSDGDVGECDLSDTINPGVEEICNNVDDNCSGGVDEDLWQTPPPRFLGCRREDGPCCFQCIDGDYELQYRTVCPS